jgi:hypothetical protein
MGADVTFSDLDPRAPIVDADTFALVVELELRRAIRLQYYVSLLVLQADLEPPGGYPDSLTLYRQIAEVIRDQIRSTDVLSVMPDSPSSPYLEVLLVSTYLDNLPAIIERISTAVNARAIEIEGSLARLSLSMGGACFPTTARARPELFHQAEALSREARTEPGLSGYRYRLAQRTS